MQCPNGLAQGSMLSPAFFDIYSECLVERLLSIGLRSDEILLYADDLAVMVTTENVHLVLSTI